MRGRQALAAAVVFAALVTPTGSGIAEGSPVCTKTGSAFSDVITGTPGPDVLCGLGGADTLKGVGGDDILIGGPGADTLQGGDGADQLDGGDANDTLRGDAGADVMSGGLGVDLVRYDDRSVSVVVSVGHGADDGSWPGLEGDDVRVDVERVFGSKANDRIVTFGGTSVQFYGRAGNDELIGGPSADLLQGDAGNDLLIGHDGRDTYNCGLGVDSYQYDGTDVRQNGCEKVAENRAPTPGADYRATPEDVPVQVTVADLLANDVDPDHDAVTFTGLGPTPMFARGTPTLIGSTITFTPAADYNGYDGPGSFTYTVSDGKASATTTVSVSISSVNDAPVAVDDEATVKQDSSVSIKTADLLANDRDIDSSKTLTAVHGASHGTAQLAGSSITFTPTAGYCGPAGFDYTLSDGALTDVGHVGITVTCSPPPPHIVTGRDEVFGSEDTLLTVQVSELLVNDTDADGHPLTITHAMSNYGEAWIEGDTVFLMPDPDECNVIPGASHYPFDLYYLVTDGTESAFGLADVWLECVNDPPTTWWQFGFTEEDTPLVLEPGEIEGMDVDSFYQLTVSAVSNPVHGSVSVTNGTVTFVPEPGYCGDEAGFDFTLSDGELEVTDHFYVFVDC